MSSRVQLKVLLDIEDCVSELKRQSVDSRTPINDDSTTLHRFQEKLELILLFGLIEKPGLLGPKKSYWNYICTCFSSSKRSHDGINFVKSIVALKTPLGRGRAFIRFCLTQKCLADTLQNCFMDEKISRDFYAEKSIPVERELWSTLVTSLYELNELDFDLCTAHTELDISWPKFARKLFTSDNENFCRNMSSPNLQNYSSQDELNSVKYDSKSVSLDSCSYTVEENLDPVKLTEMNEKLSQQNECLKEEVQCLQDEKTRLQCDVEILQKKCLFLQQQLSNCSKGKNDNTEFNEVLPEVKDVPTSSSSTSSEVKLDLKAGENVPCIFEKNHPSSVSPNNSVKSKIQSDTQKNLSECALLQNDHESCTPHVSKSFDTPSENSQTNKNIYIPQNPIYISELLLEIKTVIDDIEDTIQKSDITLAIPHISRLKKIRNCLEERFSSETDKSKNCLNFTNIVENFISSIKKFNTIQENIINSLQEKIDSSIKGNQCLHSKIRTLKELLRSYGFLKVTNEKEIEPENILFPLDSPSFPSKLSFEDFSSCNIATDPVLKRIIIPLLPVFNSSFKKLNSLNEKMIELQFGLDSSQELNNNLITRVQDQEMHLRGVSKEIEEAQQLVSVLKKQHRKLQSAEGILKYDLQEKRKLLTRLKQQLENTREDFNLVRIKNSKSEAEWKDLRKEFVERQKQTSEESGFIDDKTLEDHEPVFSNSACDCSIPQESTSETVPLKKSVTDMLQDVPIKRKRLELLEEQCQNLYSNLLQSSKRRQEIDKRLENMCKTIEKKNEIIQSNPFPSDLSTEGSFENTSNAEIQTSSEDNCQSAMFTQGTFTSSSPHSSSDVGSLNSECSSCIPVYNDANSSDNFCCGSFKDDSGISFSSKLLTSASQLASTSEQINETTTLPDSANSSEFKEDKGMILSCESVEIDASSIEHPQLQRSMSHVDSILIKKKDLEESLKILEIGNEIACSEKTSFPQDEEFSVPVSTPEEEKNLLNKVQELENRILMLSNELDRTTQQMLLSKAAKEHEVSALQFQLNSQALKYERALKEFSEQSEGIENMKQKVTEQEQLILALEDALSEIRSDRENEKEHQWQELEDIHIALDVREQECITLCQELQKSMSEVEQEHSKNEALLSQLEEFKMYNQKDKETMEAEILHLKQYSKELQKKLIKLLKEKDILWKRNNHLCHLQKIKIDDRWVNDSEVSSCMGCKNNFSFMLRKHHCRLCGRIFCYSCSNNWLLTASSSKKMRACNECFVQQREIKKVVRRGSDVPQIEDDNEEEVASGSLSFIPTSITSINSEVPSSITDSVISLPITQKQRTPHFASAPDLRYVFKPDDVISGSMSLAEEDIKDEKGQLAVINDDISKNSEVSSDECTSITLEEDIPKICRLKEISVDEIKSHESGLRGKFVINPQERDDLPIFCHTFPVVLKWSFTSNCHNIPLTITHEDEKCNSNPKFFQASNKMQDQMELALPGYYILHFDNTARSTEMEVQYILHIEH